MGPEFFFKNFFREKSHNCLGTRRKKGEEFRFEGIFDFDTKKSFYFFWVTGDNKYYLGSIQTTVFGVKPGG